MRSIMNIAQEGLNGMSTGYGNISREEEEVMQDEAAEAAGEVATGLDESERMLGLSDGLEDLAEIADGITDATETETQLLTVAGNMAVAGSEVPAEEIVPAMEGFIGGRIATESLRERASAIWKAVLAQLEKIWNYIEKFFYNIIGTIPRMRSNLKDLRSRIDDVNGKTAESKKITVTGGVKSLSVDYTTPKSGGDITKNTGKLLEAVTYVYGPHMDALARIGDTAASHISDFDSEKAAEGAEKFLKAVTAAADGAAFAGGSAVSGRWPGYKVTAGAPIMGNVSLFKKKIEASGTRDHGSSILNELERARHLGVELHATSDKSKDIPGSFEMDVMTAAQMHSAIDDLDKILDKLEDFKRGKRTGDMKKTRAKLKSASEKATTEISKAEKSEDAAGKATIAIYRGLLAYNHAYARWCENPSIQLMNSSIASVKATAAVISKSISQYK